METVHQNPDRETMLAANAKALAAAGLSPVSSGTFLETLADAAKADRDEKRADAAAKLIQAGPPADAAAYDLPPETPSLEEQEMATRRANAVRLLDAPTAYDEV